MDKIIEKLNQALTESERDKLIGHLAYHYEMMRFNGTVGMVKEIYGVKAGPYDNDQSIFEDSDRHDPHIQEKAPLFWKSGACFAGGLDFRNRTNLGGVLYNYLLKEMRIGGES